MVPPRTKHKILKRKIEFGEREVSRQKYVNKLGGTKKGSLEEQLGRSV